LSEDRYNPVRCRRRHRRSRRAADGLKLLVISAAILSAGAAVMAVPGVGAKEMEDTPVQTKVVSVEQFIQSSTEGEDPLEAEKIEEALVAQGYFRNDVPLTYDEQDFLHTACQESGVPYALALAVIEKETGFRNVIGDDGASCGFMQVQERWHWDRMERLGVTDLSDPFGNFRVGCDFLAELLDKYPVEEALTAYNSGSPGTSSYSQSVMEIYEKWKELVGDEVSGIKG